MTELPGPTVIVPIHNAFEATRACMESLLLHTAEEQRLLLIDDGSRDPRMAPFLAESAAGRPGFEVVPLGRRHGYTTVVNRGIELAGRADVVLLNSDTVVTAGWLRKLQAAAESRPRVATVTPLSNAAGAFSVPCRNRVNQLPGDLSVDDMARLVEELSERLYPQVPTGNGFCLLIRRAALDAIGPFDADAFPQGCGEENDFCMRAQQAGFVHLIDDTTFIYHRLSASLGWRKRLLVWRGARIVRRRWPDYPRQVAAWLQNDPIDGLRDRLHRAAEAMG